MKLLIYCATPSRLKYKKEEIMDFVNQEGNAPLHPFQAFPFERFEGGPIGRKKTMEFCRRAIRICDKTYVFGISEGVLNDVIESKKLEKPVIDFVRKFDPEWEKYYDVFIEKDKYSKIILEVVGKK